MYNGSEVVKVGHMSNTAWILLGILSPIVLIVFYFILRALHTTNLIVSTISIGTSFIATFLSIKRSPYYAIAYMANDIVLIILWSIETLSSTAYITLVISSCVLFINDAHGLINWFKMRKRQKEEEKIEQ